MANKKPARKGTAVRALANTQSLILNGEMFIYGIIDPMGLPGEGVRAIDVMGSLAELGDADPVVVRINSPGGSLTEGLAIYNALRASPAAIEIHVDAYPGSAASVIAMAGDEIIIADNAAIMIHDPYGFSMGGSDDMRAMADEIDRNKTLIINIYAQRTGLDPAEIEAMMSAETTMSAIDALAKGFADRVAEPMAIAACAALEPKTLARLLAPSPVRTSRPTTAAAAVSPKGKPMATETGAAAIEAACNDAIRAERERRNAIKAAVRAAALTDAFADELVDAGLTLDEAKGRISAAAAQKLDFRATEANQVRAEAIRTERERVHGINAAVRAAKLDGSFADGMIRDGLTLDQAREKIIDKFAEIQNSRQDNPDQRHPGIRVYADAQDRWAKGAEEGLMMRAGLMKADRSNEFIGLTLLELARSSLNVRNERSGGMSRMDMVGRSFLVRAEGPGFNATSDFPSVLQNVAYKALMKGFTEADETFDMWTGKGTLTDFRPAYRVDTGLFPSLDKVDEGAEYKYGALSDTGTQVVLATYGKMFAITRQAIMNDDLHVFNKVPALMGRAAKRTIGNLVYGVLNSNPVMQDGNPLFSAIHTNTTAAGYGSAPSPVSIGAARALMARQVDPQGYSVGVGARPKYILVAPEILDVTTTVLKADYLSADAGLQPNYVKDAATPIMDGRLSGQSWFLAADPTVTDQIEVDYLDGNEQPFMDQRQGWNVDGAEYKVRIDAGVKALHWRGLYRNTGAGN